MAWKRPSRATTPAMPAWTTATDRQPRSTSHPTMTMRATMGFISTAVRLREEPVGDRSLLPGRPQPHQRMVERDVHRRRRLRGVEPRDCGEGAIDGHTTYFDGVTVVTPAGAAPTA